MATFTNYATLSYNGGSTDSNTVTGEILETLSAAKTAVTKDYAQGDDIAYVLSLVNSGTAPLSELTVTDNLGAYTYNTATLYPLTYKADSLKVYVNGTLTATPTVTAGPPLTVGGITVPAGGSTVIVYEATVNGFVPLGTNASVVNQAVISGGGLTSPVNATETVVFRAEPILSVSKALSPNIVTENGTVTYTFSISNFGSTAAEASENIVLSDNFDPKLRDITVSLNGTALTAGTQYTYNADTGVFATVGGQITVPAATYKQNADGSYVTVPGTAILTIGGTV